MWKSEDFPEDPNFLPNHLRSQTQNGSCPDCGGTNNVTDWASGDKICTDCGIVLTQMIMDENAGQLLNGKDGQPLLPCYGSAHMQGDQISSTSISACTTAASSSDSKLESKNMSASLSEISSRLPGFKRDTRLQKSFETVTLLCNQLGLPAKIAEECKHMYSTIKNKEESPASPRVQHNAGLLPALVYVAARQSGVSRTLKEIASAAQRTGIGCGVAGKGKKITKKIIGRCYLSLASQMELRLAPASGTEFVPRFAGLLRLPLPYANAATEVVRRCEESGIVSGRNPPCIAATALFLASNFAAENGFALAAAVSFGTVADVCNVSDESVRKLFRDVLSPVQASLLPDFFRVECERQQARAQSQLQEQELQHEQEEGLKRQRRQQRQRHRAELESAAAGAAGKGECEGTVAGVEGCVESREVAESARLMDEAIDMAFREVEMESSSDDGSDSDSGGGERGHEGDGNGERGKAFVSPLPSPQPSVMGVVNFDTPCAQPTSCSSKTATQKRPLKRRRQRRRVALKRPAGLPHIVTSALPTPTGATTPHTGLTPAVAALAVAKGRVGQ